MENRSRSVITVLIALALAAGLAGSGCKRARHAEGTPPASTTGASAADANAAGAGAGTGGTSAPSLRGSAASSLDKSLAQAVSPSELAKAELARKELSSIRSEPKPETPPRPIGPSCYLETFHHQPTPNDTNEETSSHHGNLMTLAHMNVNPAHICVRVNGIPVKFTHKAARKGDQILIGAVAGPTARITVSYCIGKLVCPEVAAKECTVPRDEFMDALGAGDPSAGDPSGDDGAQAADAQWEGTPSDAKLNNDVNRELSDMDGMSAPDSSAHGARGPAALPIFKGWIEDQNTPACPKQAS